LAYVPVPNDLSRIKTKLAFNLTKRQLICFSIAGGIGIPFYLFTRSHIGNSTALFLMIGLMMPCFLFAMFEKDGLPFEKVLRNIIRTRFLLPKVRPYKTDNFYAFLSRKEEHPIADQRKEQDRAQKESVLTVSPRNRPRQKKPGRRLHSRPSRTGKFSRTVSAGSMTGSIPRAWNMRTLTISWRKLMTSQPSLTATALFSIPSTAPFRSSFPSSITEAAPRANISSISP